jgi:hypothetical protein
MHAFFLHRRFPGTQALVVAAALVGASAMPAAAVCPGMDVVIEDQFAELAPAWGEATAEIKVADGQLVISPAPGTYAWAINNSGLHDDVDMCVTMTTVAGVDTTDAFGGVVFWYHDVNNFYVFELAPNGRASVWRRQRGKWLAQVEWRAAENANAGDGASNELRVTTTGSEAKFYVNGTEFETIDGSPPEEGQQVGLIAGSPDDAAASFAFDGLRVTGP